MKYFYGIVEDRQDPLKIGRVRVRVHGIHTDVKALIATPDLPWSQVILPTTGAGLSGFGTQHGLVEGSTVIGFFRDNDVMQDYVVTGVAAGIPQAGYKETITDELLERGIDKGFNDPRGLTLDAYTDKPDGPNSAEQPLRTFGLTTALDTAPKQPESLEITYDATGSKITEQELTEDDLPYYPLYTDASDLSKYARGEKLPVDFNTTLQENITGGEITFPDSKAEPVYPYNKVLESESGHVFEIDDTLGKERIRQYHRSGTFSEVHPDGSIVQRIVNDNYTAVLKDNQMYVAGDVDLIVEKGNVNIHVNTGNVNTTVLKGNVDTKVMEGNADLYVKGNVTEVVDGNVNATIGGTTDVTSQGKITITGPSGTEIISNTKISGTLHVTKAQTNASSIVADGEIQTKQGNKPKLSSHTHQVKKVESGTSTKTSEKPK